MNTGTVYFARWIFTGDTLISHGALRVVNDRITHVGPRTGIRQSGDAIENLGNMILIPGMINAYTTFEDASLRHRESRFEGTFTEFQSRLAAMSQEITHHQRQRATRLAVQESLSNGITTSIQLLKKTCPDDYDTLPHRFFHIKNMAHRRFLSEEEITRYIHTLTGKHYFGITPGKLHSHALSHIKAIIRSVRTQHIPLVHYIGETAEEFGAFTEQGGPYFDHLSRAGLWKIRGKKESPATYAIRNALIPRSAMLINPNYFSSTELGSLRALQTTLVLLPRLAERFDAPAFPIETALKHGINLTIGTGNSAFSPTINILDELHCIAQCHEGLSPQTLLQMITQNAAKAVRCASTLGQLAPGFQADITGIRLDPLTKTPLADTIRSSNGVECIIQEGIPIILP
ncbi:amidohydrolase family protein [Chitinivibrio alkaliphilus]|uniref:Amidohydrolase n=1 Tax=Chitinivibrio alkaliphilus ACht1 TaxID=1313304 RepID=U7D8A5_9BACT|nr:amidohydrolase family protein [Chitinivibrio alkaliphilus]ERP31801.1 amidohydrolase [Chitinivibrio alkaliphilus ACht1]